MRISDRETSFALSKVGGRFLHRAGRTENAVI